MTLNRKANILEERFLELDLQELSVANSISDRVSTYICQSWRTSPNGIEPPSLFASLGIFVPPSLPVLITSGVDETESRAAVIFVGMVWRAYFK